MKIILNSEVVGLGEEGDVLEVSNGYARNFLFPEKKAVLFNNQNVSVFKSRSDAIAKRKEARKISNLSIKERLESMNLVVKMKTGEAGHLFGAVTSTVIADSLEKEGIEILKKQIIIPNHTIKYIGYYTVEIKLSNSIHAQLKIAVEDVEGKIKHEDLQKEKNAQNQAQSQVLDEKSVDEKSIDENASVADSTGDTPSADTADSSAVVADALDVEEDIADNISSENTDSSEAHE